MRSLFLNSMLVVAVWAVASGCEREPAPSAPPATAPASGERRPESAPTEKKPESTPGGGEKAESKPTDAKPADPQPAPATTGTAQAPPTTANNGPPKTSVASGKLSLSSLELTVPDGWTAEPFQEGGMSGTVAAYRLPKAGDDKEDAILKISHFPGMKGKDDPNIDRWLGQVQKADGKPFTRADTNVKVEEKGAIRLKIVDLSGSISASMMGGGTATPNQRMIAAIIDHPAGPHFLCVTGGEATIAKWNDAIMSLLNSAAVAQ